MLIDQTDSIGKSSGVLNAIKVAANQTGVDFSYLVKKATQESSLDPNAKASSSSATGLYQFTQQTWLKMVKKYGDQYGLGTYADHITVGSDGVARVKDASWKQSILALRKDAVTSAEMAGELDKENMTSLKANVGGKIGATELYLAHFLGSGGATAFLNEMHDNPKESAAEVLPDAAASNPNVFYNKDGSAKSLRDVYQHFAAKFEDNGGKGTLVASATKPSSRSGSNSSTTTQDRGFFSTASTTATAASYATAAMAYGGTHSTTASASPFSISALSSNATGGASLDGNSYMAAMIMAQMKGETLAGLNSQYDQYGNRKNTNAGVAAYAG